MGGFGLPQQQGNPANTGAMPAAVQSAQPTGVDKANAAANLMSAGASLVSAGTGVASLILGATGKNNASKSVAPQQQGNSANTGAMGGFWQPQQQGNYTNTSAMGSFGLPQQPAKTPESNVVLPDGRVCSCPAAPAR